jgi:hypothetical protein
MRLDEFDEVGEIVKSPGGPWRAQVRCAAGAWVYSLRRSKLAPPPSPPSFPWGRASNDASGRANRQGVICVLAASV